MKYIVKVGMQFGQLTVESQVRNIQRWNCRCSCGNEVLAIESVKLATLHTKSCGCRVPRHGMRYHPAYKSWQHMKDRCLNPNNQDYHNYGGRGISLHEDFIESFPIWLEAIGPRPDGDRWSIGRIDNNGNYTYGNMRWENDGQQARNHSRSTLNTSGIVGVQRRVRVIRNREYIIWSANWTENYKKKSKDFSASKYGEDAAKELAIAYRNKMIEKLNELGYEYAESHGTEKEVIKHTE